MPKKEVLDIANSVWGIEASRILGISRETFYRRVCKGIYKVKCVRCPQGFRYSIRDVLRVAHPSLNDHEIERLLLDYRRKIIQQREQKSKKRGLKK